MSDSILSAGLSPYLSGIYAPVGEETPPREVVAHGELPVDLVGAYVRNGPNPKYSPRGRYHWFDGDGMLHAVHFADGRAYYRSRWVQTAHLAAEEKAGKALWTGLMHSSAHNPEGAPYKDTANTSLTLFGRELLATWYISGLPYRVDASTLDTRGTHSLGLPQTRPISAHSKLDPVTGELFYFAYGLTPRLTYGEVSADGTAGSTMDIALPGPRLPHDMAITEHYAILMDLPVVYTDEALRERRWRVTLDRSMPARFAVVPRGGGAKAVRWFEADPCYIYHTVNAWEEGDEIRMVACRCDEPLQAPNYERDGMWAHMMANLRLRARLHRWHFNLRTGEVREAPMDDRNAEFPAINLGRLGRKSRYSYHVTIPDTPALRFDGLIKYDIEEGRYQHYPFGPGRYGSEAAFAPRAGKSGVSGDEDDGYVVTIVGWEGENRAEAWVFDARAIGDGPLARVQIPRRVPAGFHACWVHGDVL